MKNFKRRLSKIADKLHDQNDKIIDKLYHEDDKKETYPSESYVKNTSNDNNETGESWESLEKLVKKKIVDNEEKNVNDSLLKENEESLKSEMSFSTSCLTNNYDIRSLS